MTNRTVAGVDWAGGEWLAVVMKDGSYEDCILRTDIDSLWKSLPATDRMLVDVPIGLPSDDQTLANRENLDSLARTVTGMPSSVFPVPSRSACKMANACEDYETVADENQAKISKGLSTQSYSIAAAIGEVDEFLLSTDGARERVVESHPEVCFRGLLGKELQHSKKSAAGVGERISALEGHLESSEALVGEVCEDLIGESNDVEIDDVIDALGLCVTAWKVQEQCRTLPEDVQLDSESLPMQMAYWSEDSLV